MKKLALGLLFCGASAFAATVNYTTAIYFNGNPAITSLTAGTASLTVSDITAGSVSAPSGISLGNITSSATTATGGAFVGDTVDILVTQTSPSNGNQLITSLLAGTITSNSNGIQLSFTPTTFTLGTFPNTASYTLGASGSYTLVAPNTNGGVTSIQATVTTAPEPTSLALLGGSLFGLGLIARRRFAK
jgi:hypothetical protein